jgi:hypothetical protein
MVLAGLSLPFISWALEPEAELEPFATAAVGTGAGWAFDAGLAAFDAGAAAFEAGLVGALEAGLEETGT